MNVFVTGVAGFLGSHIAEAMLGAGHCVVGNDNLSGGDRENVPGGVEFLEKPSELLTRDDMTGVDVVYNCAALAHEGLSVFSPRIITRSIFGASVAVLSAAASARVRRIIHCSSMARYGKGAPPFTETDRPSPEDPYGIAKVAVEDTIRCLSDVHGFEYIITVPHNIIGPRQKYDDPFRNVAAIMANMMLQGRPPFIYGDGEQVRCFSDVRDIIPLYVEMATTPLHGVTVNVGPDEEPVTINQMAALLAEIIGCDHEAIYFPDRPQEVKKAICSSDLSRKLYGYKTRYSLRETLESIVDWVREMGPKPFMYHLPIEIVTEKTPTTWVKRRF